MFLGKIILKVKIQLFSFLNCKPEVIVLSNYSVPYVVNRAGFPKTYSRSWEAHRYFKIIKFKHALLGAVAKKCKTVAKKSTIIR